MHYIENKDEQVRATDAQITAFFSTANGKQWFSNLCYCIWLLTRARTKQAANAAREMFSSNSPSERRRKLEQTIQIKAFVSCIHFMASDIKNTDVIKVNFKTGEKI